MRSNKSVNAKKSRCSSWLTIVLVLALCCETYFLRVHASLFFPNIRTPEISILYSNYWPETAYHYSDDGYPIGDWLAFEEFVSELKLTAKQEKELRAIEDIVIANIDEAQKDYENILKCLTPKQLEMLKEPQRTVADHRSLGIDCVGKEQQLLCIYQLNELAYNSPSSKTDSKDANELANDSEIPKNMAPTRLMISLSRLIEEGKEPITPSQAKKILDCFTSLRQHIAIIHNEHIPALKVLSEEQIELAKKRELRHFEAFLSPVYLQNLKKTISQRRKGSAA
ncbi:MAG: hypothetical protein K6G50_00845 [bacterium]|nr:hypothetical protein [bacterium]